MNTYTKIILAIPHSVRELNTSLWSDTSVEQDADMWTDWYTDQLFETSLPYTSTIVGDVSRFDCDLERLIDDPLENIGQGILYSRSHSGATRELHEQQKSDLMKKYQSYHNSIRQEITNSCLIIDCHSFPAHIAPEIDICLGWNQDKTRPSQETISQITQFFHHKGYSVGHNNPYSNSIAPESDKEYSSIMIELNKKIYLNEKTLEITSLRVKKDLNELYEQMSSF